MRPTTKVSRMTAAIKQVHRLAYGVVKLVHAILNNYQNIFSHLDNFIVKNASAIH